MAEDRSLRARLGLSDDRMNPLLKLAEAQASKAPGLALLQLERLAKASFESSRLEVERLKKRYGEADSVLGEAHQSLLAAFGPDHYRTRAVVKAVEELRALRR